MIEGFIDFPCFRSGALIGIGASGVFSRQMPSAETRRPERNDDESSRREAVIVPLFLTTS